MRTTLLLLMLLPVAAQGKEFYYRTSIIEFETEFLYAIYARATDWWKDMEVTARTYQSTNTHNCERIDSLSHILASGDFSAGPTYHRAIERSYGESVFGLGDYGWEHWRAQRGMGLCYCSVIVPGSSSKRNTFVEAARFYELPGLRFPIPYLDDEVAEDGPSVDGNFNVVCRAVTSRDSSSTPPVYIPSDPLPVPPPEPEEPSY